MIPGLPRGCAAVVLWVAGCTPGSGALQPSMPLDPAPPSSGAAPPGVRDAPRQHTAVRTVEDAPDLAIMLTAEPGWHLYWNNPGDAGMPPTLRLGAEVRPLRLPAPERFGRDVVVFGYEGRIALLAEPAEGGVLEFMECRDVCLRHELVLPRPGPASDGDRAAIARTRREQPREPPAGAQAEVRDATLHVVVPVAAFPVAPTLFPDAAIDRRLLRGRPEFARDGESFRASAPLAPGPGGDVYLKDEGGFYRVAVR